MLLIERLIEKGRIVESDRTKLPDGVLCRVVYPICNFGQVNANHRMYEAAVWEHVLNDPELKEKLEKRSLFGHAEHPQGSASDLQLTSHVIHEMKVDGDKVYQTIDVVDTPTGRIVDCLLRAECTVGVSTRAEGELEEAESKALGKYQRVIPEKYVYITTDFTADPSTANMAPVEVRRNIVKAAESVLSETKASLGDKRFGRAVIEGLACKSSKCDGSGCGACKALKKIKEGEQFNYKEIADEVCVSVPFVDHKEVEQAAMELISDLAHPDEVNPEDVVFALVAHFKLFGKRKKKAEKMIKPEAFNPENVTGEYARESEMESKMIHKMKIQAKVSEAVHNAELQTALEAVDDLNRTYTDASQSFRIGLKVANEAVAKLGLEGQKEQARTLNAKQEQASTIVALAEMKKTHRIAAKALKESQTEVRGLTSQLHDVTAELEAIKVQHAAIQTQLEGLKKEHEAELKRIAEHNTSEISAQGIRTYAQFKIRNSGLILTESTRALLDVCKSEEEVDQVYEKIVDALREDALHQNVPKIVSIREQEPKKVDPGTAQVYAVVKGIMSGI